MKIAELKKELKSKGLPISGNKQELIERLEAAAGTELLDENDDDLDQDEQMTEEAIKEAEKELEAQGNLLNETSPAKENEEAEKDDAVENENPGQAAPTK